MPNGLFVRIWFLTILFGGWLLAGSIQKPGSHRPTWHLQAFRNPNTVSIQLPDGKFYTRAQLVDFREYYRSKVDQLNQLVNRSN